VQEEQAGSESEKECLPDTKGMLERKEKEHGKEGEREREIHRKERVCQWISGKIESKRKMDECRAE
jgi:hypothetical protein